MKTESLYQLFLKSTGVCTDTRKVAKGVLFFALKGSNFNGNEFAVTAIKKGALAAIVDEPEYKSENCYLVTDVLACLQELACHHRKNISIPVIGITGSNGKTTSKELIYSVLKTTFNTIATQGNLNNHIGVPISVLSITNSHEIAVIEMGANHPHEIADLCKIAQPNFGIVTNIGKAHIEGFGNFESIINTKNELFDYLRMNKGKCFVNGDDDLLIKLSKGLDKSSYGKNNNNTVIGFPDEETPYLKFTWFDNKNTNTIETKLFGIYNFYNAMAAVCIGLYFKVKPENINKSITSYTPDNNRSQVIKTPTNFVVMDAYNANPSSMTAAITNFSKMKDKNKIIILGDMLELGHDSKTEHEKIVSLLKENQLTALLVGSAFQSVKSNFRKFNTCSELQIWLKKYPIRENSILVKASRVIGLEKIIPFL